MMDFTTTIVASIRENNANYKVDVAVGEAVEFAHIKHHYMNTIFTDNTLYINSIHKH